MKIINTFLAPTKIMAELINFFNPTTIMVGRRATFLSEELSIKSESLPYSPKISADFSSQQ